MSDQPLNIAASSSSTAVSFAGDPGVTEILHATSSLPSRLRRCDESRQSQRLALLACSRQVRELQLLELLTGDRESQLPAGSTLFHVAQLLAAANVTVAWHALSGVPAGIALAAAGYRGRGIGLPLALPLAEPMAGWLLLTPLIASDEGQQAMWLEDSRALVGPIEIPGNDSCAGLLGFVHGGAIRADRELARALPVVTLSEQSRRQLDEASFALFAGLISGALRRMVDEAFAYARTRKSAGKPINQHQAIALRLADLALNQQGLDLYLQAAVEESREVGCEAGPQEMNIDYIAACSARISTDAVQVAGAPGYVEGLPFKRLFEQTRTLVSCMALMSDATGSLSSAFTDNRHPD